MDRGDLQESNDCSVHYGASYCSPLQGHLKHKSCVQKKDKCVGDSIAR
jgi:hypothetical protein